MCYSSKKAPPFETSSVSKVELVPRIFYTSVHVFVPCSVSFLWFLLPVPKKKLRIKNQYHEISDLEKQIRNILSNIDNFIAMFPRYISYIHVHNIRKIHISNMAIRITCQRFACGPVILEFGSRSPALVSGVFPYHFCATGTLASYHPHIMYKNSPDLVILQPVSHPWMQKKTK